ncbi:uncharacterized protein LOC115624909 [Scaptodrosophila lebanonensis]|uniref:Uncharacterized protein LOC115624909 n=1 Tax=Drosophila lebanonensis TaxID=7225 RepID=A0A6J2TKR5_DROLE|nr:uncharacterized protein LOC115624909 [Scaptodrosophila lebanonensis]
MRVAVVAVLGEPPVSGNHRRAPYPAAGWRPRVPFNLPREYLPSNEEPAEPQRLRPSVEVTKERVDFAGQLLGTGALNEPQSNYLPPRLDVPNEQALPSPNEAELFNRERSTNSPINTQQPAAQYGPPTNLGFRIIYPDDDDTSKEISDTDRLRPAGQYVDFKEGRYYIVSPDNKLQRVVYRTVQNADEPTGDGFTAQLKYSTIGELQDPIYKYNKEEQLVRVLK